MRIVLATVAVLAASGVVAHAQPGVTPVQPLAQPAQPTAPSDDAPVESYRWQTAAADGVTAMLFVGAFSSSRSQDQGTFTRIALLNYGLTVPVIHAMHGRAGTAVSSLALRIALPLAGMVLGGGGGDDDEGTTLVAGFLLGAGIAALIDTAWFARADDVPERSWTPVVAPTNGGMTVGLGGRF
jgi:hypothetical protein